MNLRRCNSRIVRWVYLLSILGNAYVKIRIMMKLKKFHNMEYVLMSIIVKYHTTQQ